MNRPNTPVQILPFISVTATGATSKRMKSATAARACRSAPCRRERGSGAFPVPNGSLGKTIGR